MGIERFALIGESWGAGLATLYATAHADRVERLLLIGPMPPTRRMLERRLDESDSAMAFRRRLAEVREAMKTSPDPIQRCGAFFALYLPQFFAAPDGLTRGRGSSCDGPAEGARNYFVVNDATFASLGDWDLRPQLARLKMPALVMEGEQSISSTVESAHLRANAAECGAAAGAQGGTLPAGGAARPVLRGRPQVPGAHAGDSLTRVVTIFLRTSSSFRNTQDACVLRAVQCPLAVERPLLC